MIALMLRAVTWLNNRFPPKFHVTTEIYNGLTDRMHGFSTQSAAHWERHEALALRISKIKDELEERIVSLEKSNAAFKDGIVKGEINLGMSDAMKLRKEFIEGNFVRPTKENAVASV